MSILAKSRLWADRRGNVAMMFGLSLPIFLLGGGLAVDYSRAANAHTKLMAAADSAALAAVSPAMIGQSAAAAQTAAQNAFNAAALGVGSLKTAPTVTIVITPNPASGLTRHVSISFSGTVNNMFAGLIGMPTTTFSGSVNSSVQQPPNIDFYVLLDNSPSMALPQTADGVSLMQTLTSLQGGCALACHMASQPNDDTAGNPYYNPASPAQACPQPPFLVTSLGQRTSTPQKTAFNPPAGCIQMDNYALARKLSIPLRIDNLTAGMTALLGDADAGRAAITTQAPPNYSFTVNTMDSQYAVGFTSLMSKTVNTYSSAWAKASQNLNIMEMWGNDSSCAAAGTNPCGAAGSVKDVSTNYDDALSKQIAQITTPGNGTNLAGDAPQAVLFFVTDGVEDESYNGGVRFEQAINQGKGSGINYCTQLKAKGVHIAILYTTYLPLTTNSFYNSNVAPFQPQIAPQLQACASPGLFVQAQVGEDLGQALGTLFTLSTQAVHLAAN